jgi:hypothetical protein
MRLNAASYSKVGNGHEPANSGANERHHHPQADEVNFYKIRATKLFFSLLISSADTRFFVDIMTGV